MRNFLIILFTLITALCHATNYYVNNAYSAVNDIYCSAAGASGNNGTSASTPKALISQVLSTYALVPGDIIYVDAGTYSDYINPGTNDNGNSTGYVKIIGAGASKTTIGCASASNTFNFVSTKYMWVEGMTINAETSGNLLTSFYLSGDADYNIIAKCVINAPKTPSWSNGVVQNNYALGLNSSSSANIPDFNSVISCTISAKKYGIYCKGHSTTVSEMADGNEFADNVIEIGNPATSGTTETNNLIYFTKNTKIVRNKFRNCFTAIYFSNTAAGTTDDNINGTIANNYFTNLTDDSDLHCGIHIRNTLTAASNIKIYNNSFYSLNGSYGFYHAEMASGTLGVSVRNNLFSVPNNITNSSVFTFETAPGTNKFTSCDYNYYDCAAAYVGFVIYGASWADLTAWKTTGNGDANSSDNIPGGPKFVDESVGNLDLKPASPMYSNCPVYNGLANDIRSMGRPTSGTKPHAFGAYDNGTQLLFAEFTNLTGAQNSYNNVLDWQTAAEENSSHFEIEKSTNAIDFVLIAKQPTKWLGKQLSGFNYHYEDELSNAYYRLKQVDTDGSFTYSKIIYIGGQKANSTLTLSPNPSNGLVKISNQFTENTRVKITVYDLFGRQLLETETTANTNDIPLSLNHLDAGWYQIIIANEGAIFQEKILLLDK